MYHTGFYKIGQFSFIYVFDDIGCCLLVVFVYDLEQFKDVTKYYQINNHENNLQPDIA